MVYRKGVLRNFAKFIWKHLCQSLFFNKVVDHRPATLLKKRLWHRCFPVNFAIFLRTPFFIEHLWWLFLFFTFSLPLEYIKVFENLNHETTKDFTYLEVSKILIIKDSVIYLSVHLFIYYIFTHSLIYLFILVKKIIFQHAYAISMASRDFWDFLSFPFFIESCNIMHKTICIVYYNSLLLSDIQK